MKRSASSLVIPLLTLMHPIFRNWGHIFRLFICTSEIPGRTMSCFSRYSRSINESSKLLYIARKMGLSGSISDWARE